MKLSCCSFITFNATPPRRTLFSLRPPRSVSLSGESTHSHRVSLAESLQSETLEILEWPAVCSQLAAFTSTSMGLSTAQSARIPLGRSPEESRRLLAQTSAAAAVPRPLDFSGIEDVSRIVDTAVAGQMLSIREICAVKRTLIAARSLLKQLEEISFQSELCERYKWRQKFRL
nr:endonuclease MutS2-like [Ipomoea batatas]GMD10257.1 endonuclease MutS2-like [Ipomoea batatas]